jgi:hypothetical protein
METYVVQYRLLQLIRQIQEAECILLFSERKLHHGVSQEIERVRAWLSARYWALLFDLDGVAWTAGGPRHAWLLVCRIAGGVESVRAKKKSMLQLMR